MFKRRSNVDNKKIDVLFGFVVIAFLAVTIILIKDFKTQRANDYKEYKAVISNIIRMKNDRIRLLAKENAELKNTLAETRSGLDTLSKKISQPSPTTTLASAPTVATATK